MLSRGLSYSRTAGRLPVDGSAENTPHFSADLRWVYSQPATNRLSLSDLQGNAGVYVFSSTCNSAELKGTPRPPIPQ